MELHGCSAWVSKDRIHILTLKGGDKYIGPFHSGPTLAFNLRIGLNDGFSIHNNKD